MTGKPPSLFVATLVQETNVFSPLPTGLQSFFGLFAAGGRVCDCDPPFPAAVLDAARRRERAGELRVVPGPCAGAQPAGRVTRTAYHALRASVLDSLARALPVDIVALELHGAMMADGYDDCEGDLLEQIRALLPSGSLIGVAIDPHAHLSAKMMCAADIVVAWKEYPHTDFRERSDELIALLIRTFRGEVRPISAVWDSGVAGIYHTHRPAVRALVDRMQSWEASGCALSVSLVHGFPWGDCADLGTRSLVVTDGDSHAATRLAQELAVAARNVALASERDEVSLKDAIDQALRETRDGGTVVLADGPDNPGGGSAGDSTFVLSELLAQEVDAACVGPLWDPGSVAIAFEAGVGARISLRIGGKTGPQSGAPIDGPVEIIALAEHGTQTFAREPVALGRAAAVRIAGIDVVLTERRVQAYSADLFTNLGVRPETKRLVVVKSSQHFHSGFAAMARRVVYLDCPGSLQTDLTGYSYRRVQRPRWPIDPEPAPISQIFVGTNPLAPEDPR